jgi:hypothetical protein
MDMTEDEYISVYEGDYINYDDMFMNSANDLSKALFLYYENSSCARYGQYREYSKRWDGVAVDGDCVVKEVKQQDMSRWERYNMMSDFSSAHSLTSGNLYSCAACGYRLKESTHGDSDVKYTRFLLNSDELSVLKYTREQEEAFRVIQHAHGDGNIKVPVYDSILQRPVPKK